MKVIISLLSLMFILRCGNLQNSLEALGSINSANNNIADNSITPQVPVVWYSASHHCGISLTIDGTKIQKNFVKFPLLVKLDSGKINYSDFKADGSDMVFYDANGSLMSFEIETWNALSTSTIWVKVTNLVANQDYTFYMYYCDVSYTATENSASVFDSFKGVWHFNETPSLSVRDSTAQGNNGLSKGSLASSSTVLSSPTGGAYQFNGSSDYIEIPNSTSLQVANNLTLSAIIKWKVPVIGRTYILQKGNDNDNNYSMYVNIINQKLGFEANQIGNGNFSLEKGLLSIYPSIWNHVSIIFDNANDKIIYYVNGQEVGRLDSACGTTRNCFALESSQTTSLWIAKQGTGTSYFFNGEIDEVRISTRKRSQEFISLEYNNIFQQVIMYSAKQTQ